MNATTLGAFGALGAGFAAYLFVQTNDPFWAGLLATNAVLAIVNALSPLVEMAKKGK
jgi:hypothetical protein